MPICDRWVLGLEPSRALPAQRLEVKVTKRQSPVRRVPWADIRPGGCCEVTTAGVGLGSVRDSLAARIAKLAQEGERLRMTQTGPNALLIRRAI